MSKRYTVTLEVTVDDDVDVVPEIEEALHGAGLEAMDVCATERKLTREEIMKEMEDALGE